MTAIYIVSAEHPFNPAWPLYAHSTKAGAHAKASELVNQIFEDLKPHADPYPVLSRCTVDNWEEMLTKARVDWGDFEQSDGWGRFDVWISAVDVKA